MGTSFSSSSSSSTTSRTRMVDDNDNPALYDDNRVSPPNDVNSVSNLHLQEGLASILVSSVEEKITTNNESSQPSRSFCMICMDEQSSSDMFRGNCDHLYCTECTVLYVETKIGENVAEIKCPDVDCTHLIELNTCRDLIPRNLFERWDKALCESLFMSSEKVYCPFENCSAMMVVEGGDDKVTVTECPSCHRLFCAQCRVTWHAGIGCDEFQRVGNIITKGKEETKKVDEDELLIQLAKKKQWRRCPSCKYFVEKVLGCLRIRCRCGFEFCYGCGSKWVSYSHPCCKSLVSERH